MTYCSITHKCHYCSITHKCQDETITEIYTIYDWKHMTTNIKYTALSGAKKLLIFVLYDWKHMTAKIKYTA